MNTFTYTDETASSVTYDYFNKAARQVERETMEKLGRSRASVTFTQNSVLKRYGAEILEVRPVEKRIVLKGDWKAAMRKAAEDVKSDLKQEG